MSEQHYDAQQLQLQRQLLQQSQYQHLSPHNHGGGGGGVARVTSAADKACASTAASIDSSMDENSSDGGTTTSSSAVMDCADTNGSSTLHQRLSSRGSSRRGQLATKGGLLVHSSAAEETEEAAPPNNNVAHIGTYEDTTTTASQSEGDEDDEDDEEEREDEDEDSSADQSSSTPHTDKMSALSEYDFPLAADESDPGPSPRNSPYHHPHHHPQQQLHPAIAGKPAAFGSNLYQLPSNGTTTALATAKKAAAAAAIIARGKRTPTGGARGRPRKSFVPIYHSQISGDKNTIKIRIRKSNLTAQGPTPNKKKSGRRKKHKTSDTDASDPETDTKRSRVSTVESTDVPDPDSSSQEQSHWATDMPENVLFKIFENVTATDGSLPVLVRLCRVCKLWRSVALAPELWRRVDLTWVRERQRTDLRLLWLIQQRLTCVRDLNLGEWKVRDIQIALESIAANCPELRGLNLSGWNGLNADNLKFLTGECEKLERLDLSSVNSASAMNAQPLVSLAQSMSGRLTHLVLAHNKLAGFTQIIASIAAHCPNLELLDISNIRTYAHNSALLHVERLQSGCPKLRVLRLTNSQIWLAQATRADQMASPGFVALEELSLAGVEDDKTTTARCVDDDGIERILKNSTKLRLLDVRGCIRLSDSGLVRGVTAWDLEHLFLSGCNITRTQYSGLELILQKWAHSLREVDLAWSTATDSLDAAVMALAEKGEDSPLRILNLCGSSVNLDPIKAVLTHCPHLHSINLQSCRALPRGIKRLYPTEAAVTELRQSLQDKPPPSVETTVALPADADEPTTAAAATPDTAGTT